MFTLINDQMHTATWRTTLFGLPGSGGGLAKRLVVPALYELHLAARLPEQSRILGLIRRKGRIRLMPDIRELKR